MEKAWRLFISDFQDLMWVIICDMDQSDHTLSLHRRRAHRRLILTWMTQSVEDECPTRGNPPQVSLRHNITTVCTDVGQ